MPPIDRLWILFCLGVANSMSAPFVALFLVDDLGASPALVGLYYSMFLAGPIVNVFIGRWSDSSKSRRPIVAVTGVWTAIGWLCLALTESVWGACIVAILFFCITSTPNSQIFAEARDMPGLNVGTLRAGYTAGWVVGPVAGAALIAGSGTRTAFIATAVVISLGLASLFVGAGRSNWKQRRFEPIETGSGVQPSLLSIRSLVVASVICIVFVGDTFKVAYLPLVVMVHNSASAQTYGLILGATAVIELILLPMLGRLGDRLDAAKLFMAGISMAVAGYSLLAIADTLAHVIASQLIHCIVLGLFLVGAMVWAQNMWPDQPGYATSIYFGARSLSVPIGGALGAGAAGALGIPALFLVPAALCIVALVVVFRLSNPVGHLKAAATRE